MKSLSRNPDARGFVFRRGRDACLLVHGLTGTPFTMRMMGEWLARRGITVQAPVLAGHSRDWQALERTSWKDWYASAEEAYLRLRAGHRRTVVAGISMGGALALHLAAHHPELDGVIAVAPALYLDDFRLKFVPLLRLVGRTVAPIGDSINDPRAPVELCYERLPLRSLAELLRLQSHLREELHLVRAPALIAQSSRDRVVPPGNARFAFERIGSKRKRLMMLERSAHVVTMDLDRERLFRSSLPLIRGRGT